MAKPDYRKCEAMVVFYEQIKRNMIQVADYYGFNLIIDDYAYTITLQAKNVEGVWTNWLTYELKEDRVLRDNTAWLNIWLNQTRPDLTAEVLVCLVNDLNLALLRQEDEKIKIYELINRRDWQKIAGVEDALKDARFIENQC